MIQVIEIEHFMYEMIVLDASQLHERIMYE